MGTGDTLHAGDLAVVVQDPHPFPISARAFASPGLEPRQEGLFEVLHGSAFAGSPDDALVAKGAPGGLGASGGELKRMALWRALSSSAPAIILDEPSVWLDQDRCAWLDQVLRTSWSDRIVVMVSHDERLIETADVVLHLEDGRLIESEVTHDAT